MKHNKISQKNKIKKRRKKRKSIKTEYVSIKKIIAIVVVLIILTIGLYFISTQAPLQNYDYVSIGALVVFALALILIISFMPDKIFFNKQKNMETYMIDPVEEAFVKRNIWQKSAMMWQAVNYLLQSLSAIFLAVIIYISVSDGEGITQSVTLYSILSFTVLFVNFVLNPNKVSMAFSQSYVDVYEIILKYNVEEATKSDIAQVLKACEQRISNATH